LAKRVCRGLETVAHLGEVSSASCPAALALSSAVVIFHGGFYDFDRCPPLDLRPQVVAELNADDEAIPAPRRRRLPHRCGCARAEAAWRPFYRTFSGPEHTSADLG